MSILRFEGARFKKAPGALSKQGHFQNFFGFLIFLAQDKNPTPMQVEIKKMTLKGSALLYCT